MHEAVLSFRSRSRTRPGKYDESGGLLPDLSEVTEPMPASDTSEPGLAEWERELLGYSPSVAVNSMFTQQWKNPTLEQQELGYARRNK